MIGRKGYTVVELLTALCILGLVVTVGVPSFQGVMARWDIGEGVRTVTAALYTARFNAVKMNRSVKVCVESNEIQLKEKKGKVWEVFQTFEMNEKIWLAGNASPVFSPSGFAAPLCSIYVESERYRYKISLSSAGRVKTEKE